MASKSKKAEEVTEHTPASAAKPAVVKKKVRVKTHTRTVTVPAEEERPAEFVDPGDLMDVGEQAGDAAGDTVTPAAGQQQAPQQQTYQHDQFILDMGRDLGLSAESMAVTPPDRLQWYIRTEMSKQRSRDGVHQAPAQQQAPAAPAQQQAPPEDEDVELPFDAAQYDPEFLAGMKKIVLAERKKTKALEDRLQQVLAKTEATEAEKFEAQMDLVYSRHPGLGTGRTRDLKPGSPELVKRMAIHQLLVTMQQQGQQTTLENDVQRIHGLLFGGQAAPASPPPTPRAASPARPRDWRPSRRR
ncbi:MAG TPA: hypothetical protein VM529_24935 [Gemmata sp.]|nr:hypothetical protein [Gemmata sp.]